MPNDPAIDAVRAARIQISKEFGDDPSRLIAHYIEFQKRYAERLLHGPDGEPESAAQPAIAADGARAAAERLTVGRAQVGMKYFWYWRPNDQWPPESVRETREFGDGSRLNIVCTQTDLPASAQRKIVRAWCERLPTLKGVEYLWLNSRVPQDLFDAACSVPGLKGLYVKWSGIKSIEAVAQATSLEHLHIGSSTGLLSIEPLREMAGLRWLGLENLKRISSLEPLASLARLEGLAVEGSMWTTQRVDTLGPIGKLAGLKYLSIINLRSRDSTLAPLFALRRLEAFHAAQWWSEEELVELRRRNPRLGV